MIIKKNIGTADRLMRIGMGIFLLILAFFSAGWSAGILVATGLFCLYEGAASWCLLYQLIGKNSCPIDRK